MRYLVIVVVIISVMLVMVEFNLNCFIWYEFMKYLEINLVDSGMISLEFIFSKVFMVISCYICFDSR